MLSRSSRRPKHALWYKDAIIYEVPVRSFFDSNGDGVGDFPGLIQKLDYVADLGVTCLWLLPFFPSPLKDDGYDIADYRAIHPSFGTLDDFRRFLDAAHERELDVIIELVVNHTSDQHAWFERARNAPTGSAERDFYVWSDTDQQYRDARIIFVDTETSNWTRDPVAQAYYWHRFFQHQPDLNYDNPAVLSEVLEVMDFWLEMGVDGFRLDAVPYLIERDGTSCENLPETHGVVKAIRRHIDERWPNCMLLAEANQAPAAVRAYFGDGDECHMAYHFPLMPRLFMALHLEERDPVVDVMEHTPPIPDTCQWALFLRNHDELTLEMVTDDERDYMYLAYGADPLGRLNVGLRRRLAPLMNNSRHRLELLTSVLFSLPRHSHHLLRRRDRDGRQRASRGSRRRAHTHAVVERSQCGLLPRRSAATVQPCHHGPGVRLPGGERRGGAARFRLVPALDEESRAAPEVVHRLWAGLDRVPAA